MSCCSPNGTACPPACPCHYVGWLPRIGFGLVLAGFGVNHYRNFEMFVGMTKGVYATVPALAGLAGLLAYIFPALLIVGGVLFAVKQLHCWSKVCILGALSGILGWAGVALMIDTGANAQMLGTAVQGAAILFILYMMLKKMGCNKMACAPGSSCGSLSGAACGCPPGQCRCK